MGRWTMQLNLHDRELHEFVVSAIDEDWSTLGPEELRILQSSARYVAERMTDATPGLLDAAREDAG